MIIKIKNKGDWNRLEADWGLTFFKETEETFELYLFKWGIAHLYIQQKSGLENVDAFRNFLVGDEMNIEIESITEGGKQDASSSREVREAPESEIQGEDKPEDKETVY